jgi:hypothetical protein
MQAVRDIETPLTKSNGHDAARKQQGTFDVHLPDTLPAKIEWRDRLRKAWDRFVVTKNVEGKYTISQPLALCILGVMLVAGVGAYWRSQDQHDKIIKLETTIELMQKNHAAIDSKIDQALNYGQSAKSDVKYLQGKYDQFALDYAVKERKE